MPWIDQNSGYSDASTAESDGFVVVAVLWILGALGVLVSVSAVYLLNSASAFSLYDDRLQTEALVSSAIELVSYQVQSRSGAPSPPHGQFEFRLGQARVSVGFRPESSLVDLNAAPKPLLAGLLRAVGASASDAETYAEMIVAWRTSRLKAEDAGGPGSAQSASPSKFAHPAELSLVKGLPTSFAEKLLPFVTVYSGLPQVNAIDAPAEVLAALPGVSHERLSQFLAARRLSPDDSQSLLPLLSDASQFLTNEPGKTKRIDVGVAFDNGRRDGAEVVVLTLDAGEEPYAVLSWANAYESRQAARRKSMP